MIKDIWSTVGKLLILMLCSSHGIGTGTEIVRSGEFGMIFVYIENYTEIIWEVLKKTAGSMYMTTVAHVIVFVYPNVVLKRRVIT